MIILDVNLLLYAWNVDEAKHEMARKWLEESFAGQEWIGLPWVTLWAFLRIATSPRVFSRPIPVPDAFDLIRGWLELPNVVTVQPGPRHEALLRTTAINGQAAGNLLSDAVLAALTIEHGARLATTDRDFTRFPGLAWFNPLIPPA